MTDKKSTQNSWSRPKRPGQRFGLVEFLIGGLFCIGFPGLVTAIAPVSWLDFHRVDQRVNVRSRTCVFFFIPYRTQELADVQNVSTEFKQGTEHRRRGESKTTRSESEGKIILHGPPAGKEEGPSIAVSVSPASYEQVEAKVRAFLADPQQQSLTLFTVANWKFGILMAIPLSLLTVLFVVGWTLWLLQGLTRPFRNLFQSNGREPSNETDAVDG